MASQKPYLLNSLTFSSEQSNDFGDFRFDSNQDATYPIKFSNNDCTVEATETFKLAWASVETKTKLHSGKWSLEFHVESMKNRQIGIGFLLDWNIGPDWGFFGYLGSSKSAWSYDLSTGDIVTNTEAIQGNLPKFTGDIQTPIKRLPNSGAVAIPAVSLLSRGQKVTIRNLKRLGLNSTRLDL